MTSPVALITGALTGIGRATALAFAKEGARVVISGRREEEGKKLVAELRKLGAEAEFVRSDVRHDEDEVPTKWPNKSGNPLAEGMEGRRPTKENIAQTTAAQTQSWG